MTHYNLPHVQPQTQRAADILGTRFHIRVIGGYATSGHITNSDHYTGLAADFMCDIVTGDRLAAYAKANAAALDVKYIIHNRKIWSVARASEGWRPYSGSSPHTDHVHISFNGGGSVTDPGPAGATGTTPAVNVRSGSYNVHSTTSGDATKRDLTKLTNLADVLSLSEIQGAKMRQGIGAWLQQHGWGFYQPVKDTAVAWDATKYDAVAQGYEPLNPLHSGKAGLMQRNAPWVLLRDKSTGAMFYQVSVHTIPAMNASHTTGTPAQRHAIEQEQHANLAALYRKLSANGVPVFVSGDINTAVGAGIGTPDNGRRRVFESLSQARALASKVIGGLASDHNALIATYRVSGSTTATGGSSPNAQTAGFMNAGNPISAADAFFKFLTDGTVWLRVAMFVGGAGLLILAAVLIIKQQTLPQLVRR